MKSNYKHFPSCWKRRFKTTIRIVISSIKMKCIAENRISVLAHWAECSCRVKGFCVRLRVHLLARHRRWTIVLDSKHNFYVRESLPKADSKLFQLRKKVAKDRGVCMRRDND